ncbi:MAG: hypothetical protein WBP12_05805 [Candidatus Saccharimonas sp.]
MTTKKKVIIGISSIIMLVVLTSNGFVNALIGFLLVGAIPGTNATIPFWAMVTIWCLVIAAIITVYVESTIGFIRSQRRTEKRRARLPKRRFGQV